MSPDGISLCARYAYPPNSLSLCGPENKKSELLFYSESLSSDLGLTEILTKFSTLFPYLKLISGENKIKDPFNIKVVEAYWLGNGLLGNIKHNQFIDFLSESLSLNRKIKKQRLTVLKDSIFHNTLPHHSFHVLNVYIKSGNINIPHVLETMDACLINYGEVIGKNHNNLIIKTKPLVLKKEYINYGNLIKRQIHSQGSGDIIFNRVKIGDYVSYHWGKICQIINKSQASNLARYNNFSLTLANNYNKPLYA